MPNRNYLMGRRYEYEEMKLRKSMNYTVIRASGSHGEFDLVSYRGDQKPEFIQCKVASTEVEANRLVKAFLKDRIHRTHYHQTITIKIKGKGYAVGETI